MWLTIKNQNLDKTYPMIFNNMQTDIEFDRETGLTHTAVNITTIEDLMSLYSLAKGSVNRFRYMIIHDGEILFVDDTTNERDKPL